MEFKTIDEVAYVKGGKRLPKGHRLTSNKTNYPYLRITDYINGYFDLKNIQYLEKSTYNEISKYLINENDIFLSIVGTIGLVAHINKDLDGANITENAVKITIKNKENYDSRFLSYYLRSNKGQHEIDSRTVGSTQKKLAIKRIKNILIPDLEISIQRKISSVLYKLDKKIEINNKIIKNLESQAQAIFKSWFVDFEPFQDGNFVESELGLIPEGWEVGKLGKSKLGKIIGSGIDEFNDEKIYLATADVSDTSINNISTKVTFDDRPSRANMQPKPLSVWFAKMKDSRKLIFVDPTDKEIINKMIFSTGFAGIQANENSFTYLWSYLLSNDFDKIKNSYAMGTTMQAINNKNINNILLAIPIDSILKEFSTITKPMIEIISNLRNQNQTLAQTRDTLLPKLMSGEIDVSNIKIDDEDIDYE